jgi:putative thiamine transport system permease protein
MVAPVAIFLIVVMAYSMLASASFYAWNELFKAPNIGNAIGMTLWTGLASTLLAWGLTAWLISQAFGKPWWAVLVRRLGFLLAVPHAAFAVGLVFLIAPSGWILRAISPWLTGLEQPPQIASSQDAYGLGLIAMLVFKEVPFLLWAAATQLQRDDIGARWLRESLAAQTLGYSSNHSFWRIVWPQLKTRLLWPLLAVLAYGLTVVDAALIAGPSNPATLSVRAWQWLQDSEASTNAVGAAAGWLLTGIVGLCAVLIGLWMHRKPSLMNILTSGERGQETIQRRFSNGHVIWMVFLLGYVAVLAVLAVGSISGVWPFPQFMPSNFSSAAWISVASSSKSVVMTLTLAFLSAVIGLVWAVTWLETAPASWDSALRKLLYLPLLLPGVLWVVGLHRLALDLQLTGSFVGVLLVHVIAVLPYNLISLSPAYLGFDIRYAHISAALGKSRWQYLLRVKWPLLRQSLLATFAVGFAVSVAQFLPTLYVGEGQIVTVTTEAVTLSSGGQRSLVAAFAWLQWLLPAVVFALAAWLGRPRRFIK